MAIIATSRVAAPTYSFVLPKERLHLSNIENAAGGRQKAQETLAVGFADDAGVQDRHHAPVGAGADQASEALLQFELGLGEGQVMFRLTYKYPTIVQVRS